jgi:Secretion system C-terminal sorting domain
MQIQQYITKHFFLIVFLLGSHILTAQFINQRYPVTDGWGGAGLSGIENNSGYFSIGAYLSLTTGNQNVHVLQTDFNGNPLLQKIYGDTNYSYSVGFQNSLTKLNNGGYALYGGRTGSTNQSNVGMLFRFDETGDTLWTKTYGDTLAFQTGRHMRQSLDGGFILLGDNGTTAASHWIVKTDSLGVIEWEQTYGGPNFEGPVHIAVCNDGGYIYCGSTYSSGPGIPADGNIRISKIDSLGNVEFTKIFGNTYTEDVGSIEQTQDGGYIYVGNIRLGSFRHPYAIRLDTLGDTIWTKTYPDSMLLGSSLSTSFKSVFELPDGSFIAVGAHFFTDGVIIARRDGLVIKIATNGDILWRKTYRIPNLNANGTDFEIKDIRPTSDGGFICAGVVYPSFPDTGTQDMWLLKIDSNGCVDTACTLISGLPTTQNPPLNTLSIYPNPSNGLFTIQLPKESTTGSFRLIDITGKEVFQQTLNKPTTPLHVTHLPKGIYFYRYRDKKQGYSGKLIIQ